MRRPATCQRGRPRLALLLPLLLLGGAGLSGCRSQPLLGAGLAIEQLLPADAALYINLNQAQMAVFLPAWLAANAASGQAGHQAGAAPADANGQLAAYRAMLEPLISRSQRLVIAIGQPRPGASTPPAAGPSAAGLYAVARGNYPASLFSLALAFDPAWQKTGPAWQHKASGLQVQPLGHELLLISNGDIQRLAAAAASPGAHPVPERWRSAWETDLAVYLPEPLRRLLSGLPLDPDDVPLKNLLINGQLAEDGRYAMFSAFEFDNAATARLLTPVCRLFFYSLVHQAWPDAAVSILQSTTWAVDGPVVTARNFRLEASATAGLLRLIP